MKPSNHLSKSAVFLALGFALGLGAANFFAAGGNDEGKPTVQPSSASSKAREVCAPSVAMNTSKTPNRMPVDTPAEGSIGMSALSEDISLSETVDASRDEAAAMEPSPEELAENRPADRPAAPRLSPQEAEELESKLRLETENAVPITAEGNETLLEHEMP